MDMLIPHIRTQLPSRALLAMVCFATVGCGILPESTFTLASDSRPPKWITIPPRLEVADFSLSLSYYTMPWGGSSAKFTLRYKDKQIIERKNGKVLCKDPFLKRHAEGVPTGYPNYEAVTVNGATEILEQRKPEPIFYVTDDPVVWKQYQAIGCG